MPAVFSILPRSRDIRSRLMCALPIAFFAITRVLGAQSSTPAAQPARVAMLDSCHLSVDVALPNCRVAYRTFGRLSAARDNVVLIPTFFAGRSEDHLFMLGAYVDTARYHVVIVDALADGASTSPSNTPTGSAAFATLTIGDMVDAQHRLLTEHLGITHLRAVVGISMGGFQAFEWAVRYPQYMDAVVPIVATPRATTNDRLIYDVMRGSVERSHTSPAATDADWMQASRVEALFMRTPRFVNDSADAHLARSVDELATAYRSASWSPLDYATQLLALRRQDISARFGGDMTRAAAAVRARMLVVWSPDDRMVDPRPAAAFARLARADTLAVPSDCGHAVFWCAPERIGRVVRAFLDGESRVTRSPDRAAPMLKNR